MGPGTDSSWTASIRATVARVGSQVIAASGVVTVTMTGSGATGITDEASDLDLNAFLSDQLLPAETRKRIPAVLAEQGTVFVDDKVWGRESERHVAWARGTWDAVQPFSRSSAYLNFIADEGKDQVQAIYGSANSERLVALKDRYDPDNVFRLNHNIQPSGRPG